MSNRVLFDAHNHVQFPAYDRDRAAVLERARKAEVKMVAVGTNIQTSREAIALAKQYPGAVWSTVGFHPNHCLSSWYHDPSEQRRPAQENFEPAALRQLAKDPQVAAIGECGLDYYRIGSYQSAIKKKQSAVFLDQVKIAQELNKSLMIHCRPSKGSDDAYEDLLEQFSVSGFPFPKIIHFFVGSLAVAKRFLEQGFYFTFGGVVTFARDYDEVVKYVPLENILLETDAPYVTPEPHRGRRNEPAYVIAVAKKLAEIKGIDYDRIVQRTTANAKEALCITIDR